MKDSLHLKLSKNLWKELLSSGDLVIDATCGNGHDTLFLADICSVIALDIQIEALQNTEKRLQEHGKKAAFHRMGHEHIDTLFLPHPPKLVVYNLGYLPGADKTLTTKTETTLKSTQKALDLLAPGGALSITCYPGHEEGAIEEKKLLEWGKSLDPLKWKVSHHRSLNGAATSPSLLWIVSTL